MGTSVADVTNSGKWRREEAGDVIFFMLLENRPRAMKNVIKERVIRKRKGDQIRVDDVVFLYAIGEPAKSNEKYYKKKIAHAFAIAGFL